MADLEREHEALIDRLIEIRRDRYEYGDYSASYFRYRSGSTDFFEEEISRALRGELYFSSIEQLNDKYDLAPIHSNDVSFEEFKRYIFPTVKHIELSIALSNLGLDIKLLKRADYRRYQSTLLLPIGNIWELYEQDGLGIFSNLINQSKSLSLSSTAENNVMWSMYSDRYNGYCIELSQFRRGTFEKPFFYWPAKILYTQARPKIHYRAVVGLLVDKSHQHLGRLSKRLQRYLLETDLDSRCFVTKEDRWSYEQEYRLLADMDEPRYVNMGGAIVKSITIGHELPPSKRQLIIDFVALQDRAIKLYDTSLSKTSYSVLRTEI